jgi:hypothetical protein
MHIDSGTGPGGFVSITLEYNLIELEFTNIAVATVVAMVHRPDRWRLVWNPRTGRCRDSPKAR